LRRALVAIAILVGVFVADSAHARPALRPIFAASDEAREQVPARLRPLMAGGRPVVARGPTEIRFLPDLDRRDRVLVVAERRGGLRWFDLRTGESGYFFRVSSVGIEVEQGLLGFAFDPDFPKVPVVYTHHVAFGGGFGGRSVVTRWRLWGDDVRSMTATSEVVLEFNQPQGGHNGGPIEFGPDGMLYVAFGDGGWQGDPRNRSQDPTNLFGTVIRIDVRRVDEGYRVPDDNPFVEGGHLPEVWAYGFRNPWRMDFDAEGRLLLADVGQDRVEEIDLVVAGGNYGWSLKEGTLCFGVGRRRDGSCEDPDLIDPIYEYRRSDGRAVIGGRVYGGKRLPGLEGRFLFGDYTHGRLWAVRPDDGDVVALGGFGIAPTCFGRDSDGEVYVGVQSGRIYKLVPGPRTPPSRRRTPPERSSKHLPTGYDSGISPALRKPPPRGAD